MPQSLKRQRSTSVKSILTLTRLSGSLVMPCGCVPDKRKKVAVLLEKKDIEISLPVLQVARQGSNRKKLIQESLFRDCVFNRIPLKFRSIKVLHTLSLGDFFHIGGKIQAIPDQQMYWLDQFLHTDQEIRK